MNNVLLLIDEELDRRIEEVVNKILAAQHQDVELRFFSADEVVKMLGVTRTTLWRWEKAKYLEPVRFGGRVLYPQSEIYKIMEGNGYGF